MAGATHQEVFLAGGGILGQHWGHARNQQCHRQKCCAQQPISKSVRIWQGDALLQSVEGGISIAENPEFRFDYRTNGAGGFRAEVDDSEGKSFSQEWPAARA